MPGFPSLPAVFKSVAETMAWASASFAGLCFDNPDIITGKLVRIVLRFVISRIV